MATFQFKSFGECMEYRIKILRYTEQSNCDRVKDYVCGGFDMINPEDYKNHPCWEDIKYAIDKALKPHGYVVKVGIWKDKGKQLIIISPDGGYYVSHFQH